MDSGFRAVNQESCFVLNICFLSGIGLSVGVCLSVCIWVCTLCVEMRSQPWEVILQEPFSPLTKRHWDQGVYPGVRVSPALQFWDYGHIHYAWLSPCILGLELGPSGLQGGNHFTDWVNITAPLWPPSLLLLPHPSECFELEVCLTVSECMHMQHLLCAWCPWWSEKGIWFNNHRQCLFGIKSIIYRSFSRINNNNNKKRKYIWVQEMVPLIVSFLLLWCNFWTKYKLGKEVFIWCTIAGLPSAF